MNDVRRFWMRRYLDYAEMEVDNENGDWIRFEDFARMEARAVEAEIGSIKCFYCNKGMATCIGEYEGGGGEHFACSTCCGHGNEDGHCTPVDEWVETLQSKLLELAQQMLRIGQSIDEEFDRHRTGNIPAHTSARVSLNNLVDHEREYMGPDSHFAKLAQAVVDTAKSQTTIETIPEDEYREFERKCSSELAKRQNVIGTAKEHKE